MYSGDIHAIQITETFTIVATSWGYTAAFKLLR